jgi:hypothetical protein
VNAEIIRKEDPKTLSLSKLKSGNMNWYYGYPDELGLISFSWLVVNLKKKTIEGHCQNRNHKLIEGHHKCHALVNTLNELANFGSIQTLMK